MEKDTADSLLQLLTALTNWSQEYWVKLIALERMLDSHPDMRDEYHHQLAEARKTGATEANSQSVSAALDNLRAKLLRD